MKRDLAWWRFVYQTGGGWRGVRWCLNCLYGPRAWGSAFVNWRWRYRFKRQVKSMSPDERAALVAMLDELRL